MRGRVAEVEVDGFGEVADGFGGTIEDCEEESDLILNARRFRIGLGGFFPRGQSARSIAASLQLQCARLLPVQ